MRILDFPLSFVDKSATATLYLRENPREDARPMPAVVILPGGGYAGLAYRESEPMALAFLAQGFQALVVNYSLLDENEKSKGNIIELDLKETAAAFSLLVENHQKWQIDPEKVFLLGCSAGGHLAALFSNRYQEFREKKPAGTLLCYPVISLTYGWPEDLSMFHVDLGDPENYNASRLVNAQTPATFLWHTTADDGVPVRNSLRYCEALANSGVPFEAHLFETGPHGLSLGNTSSAPVDNLIIPETAKWFDLAVTWLQKRI